MSMNDPIADMLTRIRNALTAGKATVDFPKSNIKEQMCVVLKREGYIRDYTAVETLSEERGRPIQMLRVTLKYTPDRKPVIQEMKRASKPSLRVYRGYKDVRPVRSGLGVSIVSTSKGVMTGKEARAQKVGGEVLCTVW